jgi:hypothetical protein
MLDFHRLIGNLPFVGQEYKPAMCWTRRQQPTPSPSSSEPIVWMFFCWMSPPDWLPPITVPACPDDPGASIDWRGDVVESPETPPCSDRTEEGFLNSKFSTAKDLSSWQIQIWEFLCPSQAARSNAEVSS